MVRYSKVVAVFLMLLLGVAASTPAMAQRFGHGHGGVRFGISLGVPLYGWGYYPPYYAYPAYAYPAPAYAYPAPVYQPPVTGYIEQGYAQAAPAPAQPQGEWFYCAESKSYYPYVRECPAGWQRVPAQPPSR